MFFVFNKRKIGSYLISIGTVAILFSIALFGEHFGDGEKIAYLYLKNYLLIRIK